MLRISKNRRYLSHEDGSPFFWLGDTAWELFARTDMEMAEHYLSTRKEQGFTVIQAVLLAELDGLNNDFHGDLPLLDLNPATPNQEGRYWQHVDSVVRRANELGVVMALLPTWGDKWNQRWGKGPEVFTPENAEVYGRWLGKRFGDADVVWVLGGDRPIETSVHLDIIRAMVRGIREGDGGRHLMTFHPCGGLGSAEFLHDEDWLDFNMRQNGHAIRYNPRYETTRKDYDRVPTKPVLDAEPLYEGHPVDFNPDEFGHSVAADVRRCLYWDLFSGAFGHTYGHHSIWQLWDGVSEGVNRPLLSWKEALLEPGACQMVHGRRLMESRPFFSRIPDDSVIVAHQHPSRVPGCGTRRMVATRDEGGCYAMVYTPVGVSFEVKLAAVRGDLTKAWWYDPRTGGVVEAGVYAGNDNVKFVPPTPGESLDWVLVLDVASEEFQEPGRPLS